MVERIGLVLLLAGLPAGPAAADFPAAVEAYDQGDYATSFAESQPLAERGDADAQYMLGYLYARGEGVARDLVRAYLWYALAARQGDSFAAAALGDLARRMSDVQLTEARALADAWKPAGD
ncbi:MAG: hypothetical protein ACE5H8_11010 [Alphaproteobacteria bacterium]